MRAKGTTGWKESHRLINVDLREDLQGLFDVVRDTLDLMPLPLTLTFFFITITILSLLLLLLIALLLLLLLSTIIIIYFLFPSYFALLYLTAWSRLIYSSLCNWLFFSVFCIFGWGVGGSSSASSAFARLNLFTNHKWEKNNNKNPTATTGYAG